MMVADSAITARWLSEHAREGNAVVPRLDEAIAHLLRAERAKGVLIEGFQPNENAWETLAIGFSVFPQNGRFDEYLQRPTPYFMSQLIAASSAAAAASPLSPVEIAHANAQGGLDLIVQYMQAGWDLSDPLWRAVGSIGHQTYVEHHKGYRLKRVLQEDWSTNDGIYQAAGYRVLAQFTDELPAQRTMHFAELTEVATRAPGSTVSYVFQYSRPRCRFSTSEQRVLSLALAGLTDADIAREANVTANAVKLAWRSIYDRIGQGTGLVLSPAGIFGRGPEKRRHALAFVRDHLEEIRPYAWPAARK
jgi:hypothetical protein